MASWPCSQRPWKLPCGGPSRIVASVWRLPRQHPVMVWEAELRLLLQDLAWFCTLPWTGVDTCLLRRLSFLLFHSLLLVTPAPWLLSMQFRDDLARAERTCSGLHTAQVLGTDGLERILRWLMLAANLIGSRITRRETTGHA